MEGSGLGQNWTADISAPAVPTLNNEIHACIDECNHVIISCQMVWGQMPL